MKLGSLLIPFLISKYIIALGFSTVKRWVLIFFIFFCKPFKINGLQYLISFEIVIFSILTPIWHQFLFFWCQAFNAMLSSLATSFSILVSSPIWLYTSFVTSIWACPIIYWRTFTSIRHPAILVQAVCRMTCGCVKYRTKKILFFSAEDYLTLPSGSPSTFIIFW